MDEVPTGGAPADVEPISDVEDTPDAGTQKGQPEIDPSLRGTNVDKDPDEWVTGDEPMTGAQASYLKTLSDQAGEEFDPSITKAEASKRIDALQDRTGRGR